MIVLTIALRLAIMKLEAATELGLKSIYIMQGGFQLLDLIIRELKSHMTS